MDAIRTKTFRFTPTHTRLAESEWAKEIAAGSKYRKSDPTMGKIYKDRRKGKFNSGTALSSATMRTQHLFNDKTAAIQVLQEGSSHLLIIDGRRHITV